MCIEPLFFIYFLNVPRRFIKLDNGQFACQPNNRCLWYDVSLVPAELKTPDFKIPTEVYSVENHAKWSAEDKWFYDFEEIKRKN